MLEFEYKEYLSKGNLNTIFVAKKTILLFLYIKLEACSSRFKWIGFRNWKKQILEKVFDNKEEYILGFDETGRSELIGPMVILEY